MRSRNIWVPSRFLSYLAIMTFSFMVMGGLGYKLVHDLDAGYSDVIGRQVPILRLTRQVTQQSAIGKRVIDALAMSTSPAEIAEARKRWENAIEAADSGFRSLETLAIEFGGKPAYDDLMRARKNYLKAAQTAFAEAEKSPQLLKHEEINARYEDYRRAREAFAASCEETTIERSATLTGQTKNILRYFLLFAVWPVLMVAVVFVHAFVSTAVTFYRGR